MSCIAGKYPRLRWVPPLVVVAVTLVVLIVAVKQYGWAHLVPTPVRGPLGIWGVWGAVITVPELKQTAVDSLNYDVSCHRAFR